jgi:hypothetical protein
MKLWAGVSLALLLVSLAATQKSTNEYLVRLTQPGSAFPVQLRSAGIMPLQHDGQVWVVRVKDEKVLRQTTEIQDVTPAVRVLMELDPRAKAISGVITKAGGIVTHNYRSVPAVAAVLPMSKVTEIERLPGVKRISKGHTFLPLASSSE